MHIICKFLCIIFERYNTYSIQSPMLFNFVHVWLSYYVDLGINDESYVDETRVWCIEL